MIDWLKKVPGGSGSESSRDPLNLAPLPDDDNDPTCVGRWARYATTDGSSSYEGFVYVDPHAGLTMRVMPNTATGMITPQYLAERGQWAIAPCAQCGLSECLEPPAVMSRVRFPDAPPGSVMRSFSSFCGLCGGMQLLLNKA